MENNLGFAQATPSAIFPPLPLTAILPATITKSGHFMHTRLHRYFDLTLATVSSNHQSAFFGVWKKYVKDISHTPERNEISEIIKDRLYLSNLPIKPPFSTARQVKPAEGINTALVVSCLDLAELAKSDLLMEPGAPQIKYHVLAMEDETARVGCKQQIHDTLQLMAEYAKDHKPIHIHCYSGVGRSAMITAMHIAHQYLLGDPIVRAYIDARGKLDSESPFFIENLYKAVSEFVFSKRNCCQFDSADRNRMAVQVLTEVHLKHEKAPRDPDYEFLAAFVQSAAYKKLYDALQHPLPKENSRMAFPLRLKTKIQKFLDSFASNQDDWYQQLVAGASVQKSNVGGLNPLHQFFDDRIAQDILDVVIKEVRELFRGILTTVNQLAKQNPEAAMSKTILLYLDKPHTPAIEMEVNKDKIVSTAAQMRL